ncbi:ABC transporter transmembrane domain-containing protein [Erysipelothrix piscisicarius]|uniref:ABC transporter transmembrane domain-containing protein n=1 Tax=Erysipelothrix piscisicarius TaxID=2485784 RepID=UPI002F9215C5
MTNVFKTMRRISKIGSWAFVGAILGGCVASLANFGLNFTFGKMTQISIEQATAGTFDLQILLTITGLFLLMFPLLVMGQTGNLMGGLNAEKRLKEHMIHHILRQKEATIRASHTGDMMTLLTSDADVINNYYFQGFNYMFIHPTVGGLAALISNILCGCAIWGDCGCVGNCKCMGGNTVCRLNSNGLRISTKLPEQSNQSRIRYYCE